MERVVVDAVARSLVEDTGQAVDDRVDIGADEKPPELVVIRCIGDDGELDLGRD